MGPSCRYFMNRVQLKRDDLSRSVSISTLAAVQADFRTKPQPLNLAHLPYFWNSHSLLSAWQGHGGQESGVWYQICSHMELLHRGPWNTEKDTSLRESLFHLSCITSSI